MEAEFGTRFERRLYFGPFFFLCVSSAVSISASIATTAAALLTLQMSRFCVNTLVEEGNRTIETLLLIDIYIYVSRRRFKRPHWLPSFHSQPVWYDVLNVREGGWSERKHSVTT